MRVEGQITGVDEQHPVLQELEEKWGKPVAALVVAKKREHGPPGNGPTPVLFAEGRELRMDEGVERLLTGLKQAREQVRRLESAVEARGLSGAAENSRSKRARAPRPLPGNTKLVMMTEEFRGDFIAWLMTRRITKQLALRDARTAQDITASFLMSVNPQQSLEKHKIHDQKSGAAFVQRWGKAMACGRKA